MTWNESRLLEVLSQLRSYGDDTTLIECKTASGGIPQSIAPTLCAFANMPQAGTIILGVDERRGFEVVGVGAPAEMEKGVVSLNREVVVPAPQLTFSHVEVSGKRVVVVEVTPLLSAEKPATYKGQPYLRQADGDYVMNSNDLRMLELSALTESQQANSDFATVPGTDISFLDPQALDSFLKTTRNSRSRVAKIDDDQRLLQVTNVIDANGNLRFGGLYALGYLPQSTEPALGATAAVRLSRGEGLGRNKNLVEIEGPLPVMLDEAMRWVAQNTDRTSRYNEQGHLVDQSEFPPTAIREVIANALVHRDLGPSVDVGKKVEIRVTERSLVVASPGGLRGLSVSQLEGPSLAKAPVNKRLYEIARYLRLPNGERLIEGESGGIQEALVAMREARLPKPRFIDNGVQFTVVFPRGSRFTENENEWLSSLKEDTLALTPTEEDLLVNLRREGGATLQRVLQEYSPLSERQCKLMLHKLTTAGIVHEADGVFHLADSPTTRSNAGEEEFSALRALGKNVPAVYQAVGSEPATLRELREATGLSEAQVRYALAPLLEASRVRMVGGQGSRTTTYERIQP